jgi:DHA1 family inner membrane transport protein
MFMGLTIANIGGVPLATWVGQNIGWRMSPAISLLGMLLCSLCGKHYLQGMVAQNQM